jgi:hypothetical protein
MVSRRIAKSPYLSRPPVYTTARLISEAIYAASSYSFRKARRTGILPFGCDVKSDFWTRFLSVKHEYTHVYVTILNDTHLAQQLPNLH